MKEKAIKKNIRVDMLLLFSTILTWGSSLLCGQDSVSGFPKDFDDSPRGLTSMRVVFYNVENLFDIRNDSLKADGAFTPEGSYHWTEYKYWKKQHQIAQCISTIGGWEVPSIVGLCEVENIHTLTALTYGTSLKKYKYSIIHHESPDRRGIDVALLYRPEKFELLFDTAYPIRFPFDSSSFTRDILYIKGIGLDTDTLHLFVSHWPSKYGGAFVTIPKRKYVASQIRSYTDTILNINPKAKIIIMGDFNDNPNEESVAKSLNAKSPEEYKSGDLVNLMYPFMEGFRGTHFYAGNTGSEWSVLDQMVVSSSLLETNSGIIVKNGKAHIFAADFLLEKNKNGMIVPYRSFLGRKYHGGFSDHLPIYLDLKISSTKH